VIIAQGGRFGDWALYVKDGRAKFVYTTDIGSDVGMPVSADYGGSPRFNGRIDVVQIDVGDDDHSHLIDPAEVARIATARQ